MRDAVHAAAFDAPYPARTIVAVAGLPLGARVELEAVAQRRWSGRVTAGAGPTDAATIARTVLSISFNGALRRRRPGQDALARH